MLTWKQYLKVSYYIYPANKWSSQDRLACDKKLDIKRRDVYNEDEEKRFFSHCAIFSNILNFIYLFFGGSVIYYFAIHCTLSTIVTCIMVAIHVIISFIIARWGSLLILGSIKYHFYKKGR